MRLTRAAGWAALAVLIIAVAACGDSTATTATEPGASALTEELPPDETTTNDASPDESTTPTRNTGLREVTKDSVAVTPITIVENTAPKGGTPVAPPAIEVPAALESVVAMATSMLVEQTGAEPGDIVVTAADFAVWPDAGLGCPQPGIEYLQVQVEGSSVELFHDGKVYTFHSDGRRVVLCP